MNLVPSPLPVFPLGYPPSFRRALFARVRLVLFAFSCSSCFRGSLVRCNRPPGPVAGRLTLKYDLGSRRVDRVSCYRVLYWSIRNGEKGRERGGEKERESEEEFFWSFGSVKTSVHDSTLNSIRWRAASRRQRAAACDAYRRILRFYERTRRGGITSRIVLAKSDVSVVVKPRSMKDKRYRWSGPRPINTLTSISP